MIAITGCFIYVTSTVHVYTNSLAWLAGQRWVNNLFHAVDVHCMRILKRHLVLQCYIEANKDIIDITEW